MKLALGKKRELASLLSRSLVFLCNTMRHLWLERNSDRLPLRSTMSVCSSLRFTHRRVIFALNIDIHHILSYANSLAQPKPATLEGLLQCHTLTHFGRDGNENWLSFVLRYWQCCLWQSRCIPSSTHGGCDPKTPSWIGWKQNKNCNSFSSKTITILA